MCVRAHNFDFCSILVFGKRNVFGFSRGFAIAAINLKRKANTTVFSYVQADNWIVRLFYSTCSLTDMIRFYSTYFRQANLYCIVVLLLCIVRIHAQDVSVTEELVTLKTYDFGDPNPVPIINENPTIYPYYKYDGYSNVPIQKEWKVVTLENDHIKVMVLPEAGGKVWGAIDKATGEEFIYKNEVMKFRNISMRGPWTSGGIEFNFGVIGHHPSTATPVDYTYGNDLDGNAYCIVGSIDLPSRTQWRVKIVLKKGKANFETQASWYNPTSFRQAYYNWMTAAAPATEDLTIYAPGDEYLDHGGDPHPYPIDAAGRDLSQYNENNFGGSKSYHVVGSYDDYFGGYFGDRGYGFGHWSTYEDSPGQKVWLWALSRSGGIWEDLLTDTDGQYIEFQAGRLLNQYAPDKTKINPISKRSFGAGAHDQWREVWFPINGIGGMSDASEYGVMNIQQEEKLTLGINSFEDKKATVQKFYASGKSSKIEIDLKAMQHVHLELEDDVEEIQILELDLNWEIEDDSQKIERDFTSTITDSTRQASNEYTFHLAEQAYVSRLYAKAEELYLRCIERDPLHIEALVSMGELYLREAKYTQAKTYLKNALEIDTYHPRANFLQGTLYRIQGDEVNALESLSWATRDIAYHSVAYGAMAEILIKQQKYQRAFEYCRKSLESNSKNMQSLLLLKTVERLLNHRDIKMKPYADLKDLDELHDGLQIEELLSSNTSKEQHQFATIFRGEFPDQALLECVLYYYNLGRVEEAIRVAELMPDPSVIVSLWLAYLKEDLQLLKSIEEAKIDFVMPFRAESLEVLNWAIENNPSWKFKYYKSLVLLGLRHEEGGEILTGLKDTPTEALFYLNRSQLLSHVEDYNPIVDLEIANKNSDRWRIDHLRSEYYFKNNEFDKALRAANESVRSNPDNYIIRMDAIRALLGLGKYDEAVRSMKDLTVLPFEGASSGRMLYEVAHTGQAIEFIKSKNYKSAIGALNKAKVWDESMGVGKPYNPDERVQDYLLAHSYAKLNKVEDSKKALTRVVEYTLDHIASNKNRRLIGIKTLKDLGRDKDLKNLIDENEDWDMLLKELGEEKTNLLSSIILETLKL